MPLHTAWNWIKTAPLPVVLAFNLLLAGVLVTFVNVAKEAMKEAQAAHDHASRAEATAERAVIAVDAKLDRVSYKLDDLLVAVTELRSERFARDRRDAANRKADKIAAAANRKADQADHAPKP